jgi:hypothetical protein
MRRTTASRSPRGPATGAGRTDVHGNPLRAGIRRVVDLTEAAVVRQMLELYALYASGLGLKAIAKRLTADTSCDHSPYPAAPEIGGWARKGSPAGTGEHIKTPRG